MQNPAFLPDVKLPEKENGNNKANRPHTFEEAMEVLGTGRFHLFIMIICGSSFLSSVNEGLSLGLALPFIKCDLETTPYELGLMNSVGFCGIILSSHFWGFMADTWGRKKVMQSSVIMAFTFSAISSFANNVWLMIALRFAVGLCISGVQSSGIAYLGEFHSNRTRAKHVTFTAMFSTLSIVYMASIGWLVIPANWQIMLFGMVYRSWRLFILLSSCINVFAFIGLFLMPESPKFELAMGREESALNIIKSVYHYNTGYAKETFPVTKIEPEVLGSNLADANSLSAVLRMMWIQTKPLFKPPYVLNLARFSYLSACLYCAAHGVYMWYPQILNIYHRNVQSGPSTICHAINASPASSQNETISENDCHGSTTVATYPVLMVMGTVFVIFYVIAAMNMQYKRILVSIWLVMTAVVGVGLLFAENFLLIQALVIVFCSSGNCGTILTAISADYFPTRYKGMALCLLMISARLGAVIGNNIIAALLMTSCDTIFYTFTVLLMSSVFIFLTIPSRSNLAT